MWNSDFESSNIYYKHDDLDINCNLKNKGLNRLIKYFYIKTTLNSVIFNLILVIYQNNYFLRIIEHMPLLDTYFNSNFIAT